MCEVAEARRVHTSIQAPRHQTHFDLDTETTALSTDWAGDAANRVEQ